MKSYNAMDVYEALLHEVYDYRRKYLLKGYQDNDIPAYSIPELQYWDFKNYVHKNRFLFPATDKHKNKYIRILGIEIIPYQLIENR